MQALRITRCTDGMRWYAGLIGKTVPFIRIVRNPDEYQSREPSGLTNFVQVKDAEIIEIDEDQVRFYV